MPKGLLYKVECKSTMPCYEPIAAFDCQTAAEAYAEQCAANGLQFSYRVKKGRRILREVCNIS